MAHPYGSKGAHVPARQRAASFLKRGGRAKHADAAQDKALFQSMMAGAGDDSSPSGQARGGRLDKFARGGRARGKGKDKAHNQINVVIAPHKKDRDGGGGLPAGAMPPGPPPMPPPGPPMGGMPPPGGPPGGLPPGLAGLGGGGPRPPMGPPGPPRPGMKRGGKVPMTGGAETGVGRKEKAKHYNARTP